MSLLNYFNSPKITLKKPSIQLEHSEAQTLNYAIICFLNRDIADNMEILSDNKFISERDVKYFTKMADTDVDFLEGLYKNNKKMPDFSEDFSLVQNLFEGLAKSDLSEYQMKVKFLHQILTTIYQLKFIKNNLASIIIKGIPQENTMRILNEKLEELQISFNKLFSEVSNQKDFDFDKHIQTFNKIKKMKYSEFRKL